MNTFLIKTNNDTFFTFTTNIQSKKVLSHYLNADLRLGVTVIKALK